MAASGSDFGTFAGAPVVETARHELPAPLRVAMIGYAFMGAADSEGWRNVGRVFALPVDIQMRLLCGRDPEAADDAVRRFGWQNRALIGGMLSRATDPAYPRSRTLISVEHEDQVSGAGTPSG